MRQNSGSAALAAVVSPARNRYWVIPPFQRDAVPWNPYDPQDVPVPDCIYLGRALVAMEAASALAGLSIYLDWNNLELPEYGDHVVALALADEWARRPRYAGKVRVIFKTYGTDYPMSWPPRRLNSYALVSIAQDLRVALLRRAGTRISGQAAPIFPIPLGYYRQIELPVVPMRQRRYDVYFGGSTFNEPHEWYEWRHWLQSPKNMSRANMLRQLELLAKQHPRLSISTTQTASFLGTTTDDVLAYSHSMMQTRICVVPRGTSLETYRYFEGMRAGCVVLCERLPSRWFYDGAPAITVDDWSELNSTILRLLSDPEGMERLHLSSLAWYNDRCSPAALGLYLAQRL